MNLSGIGTHSISTENGDQATLLKAWLMASMVAFRGRRFSGESVLPLHNPKTVSVPDIDRILVNANGFGVYGTLGNENGPGVDGDRTARTPDHGYFLRS